MNLMKKILMPILSFILFTGCNNTNIANAKFTNVTPAIIEMNDSTYILTEKLLSTKDVDKQIGKITQVYAIVSYMEGQNPYNSPSKIYKIRDVTTEDSIAVEVNNKVYMANIKK